MDLLKEIDEVVKENGLDDDVEQTIHEGIDQIVNSAKDIEMFWDENDYFNVVDSLQRISKIADHLSAKVNAYIGE